MFYGIAQARWRARRECPQRATARASVVEKPPLRDGQRVRHPNVAGWLFATTHFVSIRTARAEFRRKLREIAAENSADTDLPAPADWVRVRPALDGAILSLNRQDRQAIILRYFRGRAVADVAKSLQITEGAAYKRLERAIERLRAVLAKRGIISALNPKASALRPNSLYLGQRRRISRQVPQPWR